MDKEEGTFEFSGRMEKEQVADYLEALARHLRTGHVQLSSGTESIALATGASLKVEVSAKVRPAKAKGSLDLSFSWKRPPHFEEPLRIQAGEAEEQTLEVGSPEQ